MYCKKCGNYLDKGSKFCGNCGCKIDENLNSNNMDNRGIISSVLGIFAIINIFNPLCSIFLAITSIVLGRMYKKNTGNSSIGVILGVVSLIINVIYIIVIIVFTILFFKDHQDVANDYLIDNFFSDEYYIESFDVKGNYFKVSDGSVIYFGEDMKYNWYKNTEVFLGDYEVYNGINAVNYIIKNYNDFGSGMNEQFDKFDNSIEKSIDNYYLIILNDLENNVYGSDTVSYCGFYDKYYNSLNMINIVTEDEISFTITNGENDIV